MLIELPPKQVIWSLREVAPSELRHLEEVRKKIAGLLKGVVTERDCNAVQIALEEVLVNAVKHGNRYDLSKEVAVAANFCEMEPGCMHVHDEDGGPEGRSARARHRFLVDVKDEGEGFDPDDVPDCTAEDRIEVPNGRGVLLMGYFMDEAHFLREEDGMRVILLRAMELRKEIEELGTL